MTTCFSPNPKLTMAIKSETVRALETALEHFQNAQRQLETACLQLQQARDDVAGTGEEMEDEDGNTDEAENILNRWLQLGMDASGDVDTTVERLADARMN